MTPVLSAGANTRFQERNVTPLDARLCECVFGRLPEIHFFAMEPEDELATPSISWLPVGPIPWCHVSPSGIAVHLFDLVGFEATLRQIGELASGEEIDEYGILRPTHYAFLRAVTLLNRALRAMMDASMRRDRPCTFPRGAVTTDENGGLRIEWSDDDRAVHLVVPSRDDGRSYIYYEIGQIYGTESRVTGSFLSHWLLRLFAQK
jgi:hypothetical protein